MIKTLNIKDVATYDSVKGVSINDLKRVNFFFGYNGSGKSTIGKFLHNLSLDSNIQNSAFNQCSQEGYNENHHQIITFNEDFVEVNFVTNSELKGIFSLNGENAGVEQKIRDKENEIKECTSKINEIETNESALYEDLLEHCWTQRQIFENFKKIRLGHSGSKSNHLKEVKGLLRTRLGITPSIENLANRYQNLYEKELKKISTQIDAKVRCKLRKLEKKISILLQKVIVGNEDVNISMLIQRLNSRKWIREGLVYVKDLGNTCPFCQKETINAELREQFSKFFDETYKKKITELKILKKAYHKHTKDFISNVDKIKNEFNPENKVSNLLFDLNEFFKENADVITQKIEHSNEKKSIKVLDSKKDELSEIVNAIDEHNQLFSNLDANKKILLDDIWKYIAQNCQEKIESFDNSKRRHDKLLEGYKNEIKSAKENIEELRNQTTDTKEAVDDINRMLKNTGFEGFEIAEEDKVNNISRYYLKRSQAQDSKSVFKTLSEGEKNFISFLYFYQLCLGTNDLQNSITKEKIIVIDDPVSSLDSQALFFISELIRDLIQRKGNGGHDKKTFFNQNISQVFILTHNFYFYKEVSLDKKFICTDYFHFIVKKTSNTTSIRGTGKRVVKDDYSLLWLTLKEIKENLHNGNTSNITISNTMRRIIESYVNFTGLGTEVWSALLKEDKSSPTYHTKRAFISQINDGSHGITDFDGIHYQKITNEQPQVLFEVFHSIFKSIGEEHYEMMMRNQ